MCDLRYEATMGGQNITHNEALTQMTREPLEGTPEATHRMLLLSNYVIIVTEY